MNADVVEELIGEVDCHLREFLFLGDIWNIGFGIEHQALFIVVIRVIDIELFAFEIAAQIIFSVFHIFYANSEG